MAKCASALFGSHEQGNLDFEGLLPLGHRGTLNEIISRLPCQASLCHIEYLGLGQQQRLCRLR